MPEGIPASLAELKKVLGANPAAGAEVDAAVPAGKYWWLRGVSVVLVQGLTQTPQPVLQIDDGIDVLYESFGASAAQAASTTARYTWATGTPLSGLVGATPGIRANAPLPFQLVLGPGWHVRTITPGIGANSDYGVPALYVVEYS